MSEMEFPEPAEPVEPTEAETLKAWLDAGEDVTVLDTRAPADFESWHLDGPTVTVENVPYWEFLDDVTDDLLARVPDGDPVVVVCAKGASSEYVAGVLEEHGREATNLAGGMNGWARLYEYDELDTAGDAVVAQYRRPSSGCLAYLVVADGEAAVIDPLRAFADTYVRDARALGADLVYAIDTHVHADHVSGVRTLATEANATAIIPEAAEARGVDDDTPYETVAHGDMLTLGDVEIEVVHTPGHTTGMTSYLVDGEVLATGDGLFTESVARPDLEKGDDGAPEAAARLYDSLHECVLTLPDDTVVAPAHFSDAATPRPDGTYVARLGDLVDSMNALSMEPDEFVEFVLSDVPPRPANYEEIIATNLGQQSPDDETAFELELGPNNCAASRDAMTSD